MIYQYLHLITATGFVFAYFCLVVLGEYLRSKKTGASTFSFLHNIINIAVLLIGVFVFSLFNYYILNSKNILDTVALYKLYQVPTNWITFFALLLIIDFLSYVSHYLYHKFRFFWAFHAVHHSDSVVDASTILRVSWSASLFSLVSYVLLTYVGVDRLLQVAVVQTIFLHQILSHSSLLRGVLPNWVRHYIVTPEMHAIHHLKTHGYYNLSFMFPFWDKIFGTLYTGRTITSTEYGVPHITNMKNPIAIHFEPLIKILGNKK